MVALWSTKSYIWQDLSFFCNWFWQESTWIVTELYIFSLILESNVLPFLYIYFCHTRCVVSFCLYNNVSIIKRESYMSVIDLEICISVLYNDAIQAPYKMIKAFKNTKVASINVITRTGKHVIDTPSPPHSFANASIVPSSPNRW
jgi:hypothetical protein